MTVLFGSRCVYFRVFSPKIGVRQQYGGLYFVGSCRVCGAYYERLHRKMGKRVEKSVYFSYS